MGESLLKPLKIGELTAPVPVIQGGMGVGISLSGLAGAAAACGGIGIISTAQIGYRDQEFDTDPIGCNLRAIKEEIDKARDIVRRMLSAGMSTEAAGNPASDTDAVSGIIGVNIMVATKKYEEYVKAAVAAGADLIISGAGLPMTLPELVGKAKTKIAPIVSSLKSAQVIIKYWLKKYNRLPDLVVIEGPLAGGHLGFAKEQLDDIDALDYDEEIRRIIHHVDACAEEHQTEIPVVVAGGVYTREDAEHCFALGASGVQIATRFVTTYECDAPEAFKQAYLQAKKEDIVIVKSPVGMPGRAISNAFMERASREKIPHGRCHNCIITCKPGETPYCITDALVNAARGNVEDALLFCGANAYQAERMEHVADIMKEFMP